MVSVAAEDTVQPQPPIHACDEERFFRLVDRCSISLRMVGYSVMFSEERDRDISTNTPIGRNPKVGISTKISSLRSELTFRTDEDFFNDQTYGYISCDFEQSLFRFLS